MYGNVIDEKLPKHVVHGLGLELSSYLVHGYYGVASLASERVSAASISLVEAQKG